VVKEIKVAANCISSSLEKLSSEVPSWTDTVDIMAHVSSLIDSMVTGASMKDLIEEVLSPLNDVSQGVHKKIE
jgi:phage-related tail fiber protein